MSGFCISMLRQKCMRAAGFPVEGPSLKRSSRLEMRWVSMSMSVKFNKECYEVTGYDISLQNERMVKRVLVGVLQSLFAALQDTWG